MTDEKITSVGRAELIDRAKTLEEQLVELKKELAASYEDNQRLRSVVDRQRTQLLASHTASSLTLDQYQVEAAKTSQWPIGSDQVGCREHKIYCALKMPEEVGEANSPVTKAAFNAKEEDVPKVEEELGDVLWFVAEQSRAHGLTLERVAKRNIAKLHRRYGGGSYSHEKAHARRDEA